MEIYVLIGLIGIAVLIFVIIAIKSAKEMAREQAIREENERIYRELESAVLRKLGFRNWSDVPYYDRTVRVKSRQALDNYDDVRFFKENSEELARADRVIEQKRNITKNLREFLSDNEYKDNPQYGRVCEQVSRFLKNAAAYRIHVIYISSAGNRLGEKGIELNQSDVDRFKYDPSLLMGKTEYNKYLKEQQKEKLEEKQHDYYGKVNDVIDFANEKRDMLFIKGSADQLDKSVEKLFDRTVNSIKKVKSPDSDEWQVIRKYIKTADDDIRKVVWENERILKYYESVDFLKIKTACETLMSTQRDFNEYITEKADSISHLFGTRVVRNETINDDEYQYVRPYKKTITPFTAEVSAAIFSSAENNPIEYVIKNFYPNKALYPEQIQKLHLLVEELETLKEAKQIIDNYKAEYQQYLGDVPDYVMDNDEDGFYSRLGFANIDESVLAVEYKFSYTSGGGMAKRTFTVPMTEETVVELIKALEGKLSASAFTKEQRALMTSKLREYIKNRDNYTCCNCGNSTFVEPNLLLEIDHIIPVSKGGCTTEDNLQTLCWKCNRAKSNKVA